MDGYNNKRSLIKYVIILLVVFVLTNSLSGIFAGDKKKNITAKIPGKNIEAFVEPIDDPLYEELAHSLEGQSFFHDPVTDFLLISAYIRNVKNYATTCFVFYKGNEQGGNPKEHITVVKAKREQNYIAGGLKEVLMARELMHTSQGMAEVLVIDNYIIFYELADNTLINEVLTTYFNLQTGKSLADFEVIDRNDGQDNAEFLKYIQSGWILNLPTL